MTEEEQISEGNRLYGNLERAKDAGDFAGVLAAQDAIKAFEWEQFGAWPDPDGACPMCGGCGSYVMGGAVIDPCGACDGTGKDEH